MIVNRGCSVVLKGWGAGMKKELFNRNLHISGLWETKKVDIGEEKVDIHDNKVDIKSMFFQKKDMRFHHTWKF